MEIFLDPVFLTILFIISSTLIASMLRNRKDKCLKDFNDNIVVVILGADKIKGNLHIENTGIEVVYPRYSVDNNEYSYIIYKSEYVNIEIVMRYHKDLTEDDKISRTKDLNITYHPAWWRRWARNIINVFRSFRDAMLEVSNVITSKFFSSQQYKKSPLVGQEQYLSKMQKDLIQSINSSFEPMLERHIGDRIVVDVGEIKYSGVLKDYTANFIEILDVDCDRGRADLIIPRRLGIARYLGEQKPS